LGREGLGIYRVNMDEMRLKKMVLLSCGLVAIWIMLNIKIAIVIVKVAMYLTKPTLDFEQQISYSSEVSLTSILASWGGSDGFIISINRLK